MAGLSYFYHKLKDKIIMAEQKEKVAAVPQTQTTVPSKANVVSKSNLQKAVAAIAEKRQNDDYAETNKGDIVQYRNGIGRLIVSVNKLAEKDAVSKAKEILAGYKNFTEAHVISAKPDDEDHPKFMTVVTNDGEKYRCDLTTGTLA